MILKLFSWYGCVCVCTVSCSLVVWKYSFLCSAWALFHARSCPQCDGSCYILPLVLSTCSVFQLNLTYTIFICNMLHGRINGANSNCYILSLKVYHAIFSCKVETVMEVIALYGWKNWYSWQQLSARSCQTAHNQIWSHVQSGGRLQNYAAKYAAKLIHYKNY